MPPTKPHRPPSTIVYGILAVCLTALATPANLSSAQDYPIPRTVMDVETIQSWQFASDAEGFRAVHDCQLEGRDGLLVVTVTGSDPYLLSPPLQVAGPCRVRIRMRGLRAGPGQIFWITDRQPQWSEGQSTRFPVELGDRWCEYDVDLPADGEVRCIRLDPGGAPGTVEIDRIEILRYRLHPLEIQDIESDARRIGLTLYNHDPRPIEFSLEGRRYTAKPAGLTPIELTLSGGAAFEAKTIFIQPDALPEIRRTIFLYRSGQSIAGPVLRNDKLTVRAAGDAAGAELEIDGRVVAILAPLVHIDGALPAGRLVEADDILRWEGSEDLSCTLGLEDEQVHIRIESKKECEGPVLRALGHLAQGVFAGLEYLGPNEASSSRLDIETAERLRFVPDILKVTLPLMA
ncbi:MAG: hypothetical protein JW810_07970, partial [Sedimentisphaerales bacterium]|nr:hypothetical protein [Sedimentisphaerales bacterium]